MEKYKIQPWAHQLAAITRARDYDGFALFFEMGCGKSSTLVNILRERYTKNGGLYKTLIICPIIVVENWRREFIAHSHILPKKIITLTGYGAQKAIDLRNNSNSANIFITNYEAFQNEEFFAACKAYGFEVIACDESHKIKDIQTKRAKKVIELGKTARFKYILSGSPVLNSPMDLFSQYKFLDNGETFGDNFFVFRSTYLYDANAHIPKAKYFPAWKIRPKSLEAINKKMEAKSMRIKKIDCLDLPPLVREVLYVDLSADQLDAYTEMKEDFISYVGGAACVAQLAITKALRMMQILSGFATVEDPDSPTGKRNLRFDTSPRLDAMKELLKEITPNHKVIIWACWRENFKAIKEVLDFLHIKHVEVHGEHSAKEKVRAVDTFNEDYEYRVLLGNPSACGTGVNLTAASYAIYFSRNFSLEQDIQSEARNHRGGSEVHDKITRIDLVAKDTIDELIVKRLHEKQVMGETILGDIKGALNELGL